MKRLTNKQIRLDKRVKSGYYSDAYFVGTKKILEKDKMHPVVRMQVFQKNDNVVLCGVDEALVVLKESLGKDYKKLKVFALEDGDIISGWETVMLIEGDYSLFAHLETVYLGALARGTRIATNVYRCVKAADGKPVLFFPARFDSYLVQSKDGYSYKIGNEVAQQELAKVYPGGVSTDAQGEWWGSKGIGTIPHGLIAAYGGDTVRAAMKFAEHTDPSVKRVVLVDWDNDCVKTSVAVGREMHREYFRKKDPRYKLFAVRLDTSGSMVDNSIAQAMQAAGYDSSVKPTGVTPELVKLVKEAFIREAGPWIRGSEEYDYWYDIGVIVSGGFTPERIKMFEDRSIPVSAYGVGSSLFNGNFDFTADIVSIVNPFGWAENAKKGRYYRPNGKLKEVK